MRAETKNGKSHPNGSSIVLGSLALLNGIAASLRHLRLKLRHIQSTECQKGVLEMCRLERAGELGGSLEMPVLRVLVDERCVLVESIVAVVSLLTTLRRNE